jgi:hypothetical protein
MAGFEVITEAPRIPAPVHPLHQRTRQRRDHKALPHIVFGEARIEGYPDFRSGSVEILSAVWLTQKLHLLANIDHFTQGLPFSGMATFAG